MLLQTAGREGGKGAVERQQRAGEQSHQLINKQSKTETETESKRDGKQLAKKARHIKFNLNEQQSKQGRRLSNAANVAQWSCHENNEHN